MICNRGHSDVRISTIIPTYNRDKTLKRAIDSILAQQYPASEIIVVDDGSTDSTEEIVEKLGENVRYLYQENAGVSAARNRGVEQANYDWVAFLDSDDYWTPGHLSSLAEVIQATNAEAALYFCDTQFPHKEHLISYWQLAGFRANPPYQLIRDASPWVLMPIQPMLLQSSAIKRASYREVGGLPFGLRTREDTLLFFKLGLRYPACAVAGGATIMTSDGAARLTQESGSTTLAFKQASLAIYKEMFDFASAFRPEFKIYFRGQISRSYYSLGRYFYRRRQPLQLLKYLMGAACKSPLALCRSFWGSLRSRL
jgi:glycosyltransferase involved in cell wall biosynthesis